MFPVSAVLISLATAIDPQCQALIDANSQTLDLIRTIQVHYTLAWIEKPQEPVVELWWSRDGRKERIKCVGYPNGPASGELARHVSDLVISGDTCKFLQNWDPKNPQKITPTHPGNVGAHVSPRDGTNPGVRAPSHNLFFEVDNSPRRTLSELAKVSPSVACKGKVQVDGRELWLISLESPEEATAMTEKNNYDVYLDPQAGHMIRRIVVHASSLRPNGKIEKHSHAHEVVEFKDFGDGVFVPTRIKHGGLDKFVTESAVTSVKVNEPIPPETFEMHWPKYALVVYHPPVNGECKFEVWGDGKPLGTFKGADDLHPFEAELRKDPVMAAELGPGFSGRIPPPPSTSTMVKLGMAFVALLMVMIAIVIRRRLREQAA